MNTLSVVIPNYNYGQYISQAVQSALDIKWDDVEIIVVDDGSTDNSLDILSGFGDKIRVIVQENAGPRVACNRGFAASRGDAVIFLDSDDVLESSIANEVASVWRSGISKVQVQMTKIDSEGRPSGGSFPSFNITPTADQIRYWMITTASYPTPPGSGNVYSRCFLEQLFPLDDRCGDATDSACLAAAPFLGDVVTLPKPLVRYRIHGGNRSSLRPDPTRFYAQLERARQRQEFAWSLSKQTSDWHAGVIVPLRRGRHLLQMRVSERRLCSGPPPIPTDGRLQVGLDSIANLFAPGPESWCYRFAASAWTILTLIAPLPLARKLIQRRFH